MSGVLLVGAGGAALGSGGGDLLATTSAAGYHADAVHFDGSTFLARGAPLTGVVDSPAGTLIVWLKAATGGGSNSLFGLVSSSDFTLEPSNPDTATTSLYNESNSDSTAISPAGAYTNAWVGLLQSWNVNTAPPRNCASYVNGVLADSHQSDNGAAGFDVDYTDTDFQFGSDGFGFLTGDVANFAFWPGVSILELDNTISPVNLAKFFNGSNKPVDPAVATLALGAPCMLFSGNAAAFGTNQGTGGVFMTTGTLTDASTSPSD